jgi:hypothetical protein
MALHTHPFKPERPGQWGKKEFGLKTERVWRAIKIAGGLVPRIRENPDGRTALLSGEVYRTHAPARTKIILRAPTRPTLAKSYNWP